MYTLKYAHTLATLLSIGKVNLCLYSFKTKCITVFESLLLAQCAIRTSLKCDWIFSVYGVKMALVHNKQQYSLTRKHGEKPRYGIKLKHNKKRLYYIMHM